ncbi:Dynamin family protein [Succiniclasticum ruminis]|uniref:Dynamin family protein n=1 Tax=Succiniclasticum ruminis TaxID=40841 RepID=A0A1G6KH01_9FIRM|nr:dynamin family protein [Succiniclasticum ruminis]SDC30197.1 Dynamin family protein [Succiniclasticum ruminis]
MSNLNFDVLIKSAELLGYNGEKEVLECMQEVYQSGEYFVAFIGQFSSGKSCLINSLLKRDILPKSRLETTPLLTYIRYGEQEKATVYYLDGHSEDVGVDEIAGIVQKGENNAWDVETLDYIEIFVKDEVLKEGLILLDTPGINTLIERHEQLLAKTMNIAAKVIYVAGKAPTAIDVEKMQLLKERGMDVIFVRTHCDEINEMEESKADVLNSDAEILKQCHIGATETFHVSNLMEATEWYSNILGLRNMLQVLGSNITTARENDFSNQLDFFKKKYANEMKLRLEQLEAKKNNDEERLNSQKTHFENRINNLEYNCEIEQNRINEQIEQDIKSLRKSLNQYLENGLEKLRKEITETETVSNNNELRNLLYEKQRKMIRQSLNYLNTQINPLLETINGSIVLENNTIEQLDIPEMERFEDLVAAREDELSELRAKLKDIQSNREQLCKDLVLSENSPEYKEIKENLEALSEQLKALQKEQQELGPYIPKMVEIIDSGLKPSDVGKTLGNLADWALIFIPGLGEGAAVEKAAVATANAGKTVANAGKVATTVGKTIGTIEKVEKIVAQGKTVTGTVESLRKMGKVYKTKKRIEQATELLQTGVRLAKQAHEVAVDPESSDFAKHVNEVAPTGMLDYLTLEYWGGKLGSCFDEPPKYEEDQEYHMEYEQTSRRIREEIINTQKAVFEKKCKLGIYKTQQEKEKARIKSMMVDENDLQNKLTRKEKEIRVTAQKEARKKWLANAGEVFAVKTQEALSSLLEDYLADIPDRLKEYMENRLAAQVELIKREKANYEKMLALKPDDLDAEINKINDLLICL